MNGGLFDKEIEKLVKIDGKKIEVDWKEFKNKQILGYTSYEFEGDFYKKLKDLDILSLSQDGNFEVRGCDVSLNPRIHIFKTYFTSEEQAKSYKESMYGNTMYEVSIIKTGVIK